jgi:type I restriction enzyme, S subunit
MTRPNLNAVAMVPESLVGAVCSTGFHVLRAAGVDPRWLFAAVQTSDFVSTMSGLVQGALYPAVRPRDIKGFEIPVPPLPEQRRIVAEIETQFTRLDAAVAALERARANLKRYRESLFHAAISGRLSTKRGAVVGTESPPVGWRMVALAELGKVARGKSKHRPRNDPRLLGGPYPFIQTGDVRRSTGYIRDYSATYSEFGLAQSKLWPEGTLCITIAANIAETGILTFPACFPDSVVGFDLPPVFGPSIMRVRPIPAA